MARPHTLRRVLAWCNAALCLGVVAVAVNYTLHVRPAVAADLTSGPHVPRDARRTATPAWRPVAPVSLAHLDSVFFKPGFRERRTPHWPFTGPMMQPETPLANTPERQAPRGLEALGHIEMVVADVLSFVFKDGRMVPYRVGEVIRSDGPGFRLTAIRRIGRGRYEIVYAIVSEAGEHRLLFDAEAKIEGRSGLDPVDPDDPDGPVRLRVGPPVMEEGPAPETKPAGGPAWRTLKVRVAKTPVGVHEVSLDVASWEMLRRHGRKALAESVRTTPVADAVTGAPVGLRLAFDQPELAEAFQIKRGDVLVSVNGRPVHTRADLLALADTLEEGELVTVVIDRNGKRITYRVDPRDPRVVRGAIRLRRR